LLTAPGGGSPLPICFQNRTHVGLGPAPLAQEAVSSTVTIAWEILLAEPAALQTAPSPTLTWANVRTTSRVLRVFSAPTSAATLPLAARQRGPGQARCVFHQPQPPPACAASRR